MNRQEFRKRLAGVLSQKGQIPVVLPTFGDAVDEIDLETEIDLLVNSFTGMKKADWRVTKGLTFKGRAPAESKDIENFLPAVQNLSEGLNGPICLMAYDFASILNNLPPALGIVVMRQVRDWNEAMKACDDRRRFVQIIVVDREEPKMPVGQVPFQLPVPDRNELTKFISDVASVTEGLRPFDLDKVANALTGLPFYLVADALAAAQSNTGTFDAQFLVNERGLHLRKAGLELLPTDGWNMDSIGGNENVKDWVVAARIRFTDRTLALQYCLKTLRGLLLCGVQGTGKTALAKAIAGEFGVPLVLFKSVMGKYLGQSEETLRTQLAALDAIGDIVVLIDEISDMFGGTGGGDTDGGASGRVRSELLTWMAEHKSNVFIVATTNDPDRLPPQMTRDGRLDDRFSVMAPTKVELASIIEVMKRRYPMASDVDTAAVVSAAQGLVGAEVEGAFVKALEAAMVARSRVSTEMVVTRCMAKPRSAEAFDPKGTAKAWMDKYCVPASKPDAPSAGPSGPVARKSIL